MKTTITITHLGTMTTEEQAAAIREALRIIEGEENENY